MGKTNTKTDLGLSRFLEINQYLFEQETPMPAAPPAADPATAGAVPPEGEEPLAPEGEVGLPPEGEEPLAPEGDEASLEADPMADDDSTEEVDITDLVNMIKDVKKNIDQPKNDPGETQRMDDVFTKLGELESKLGEMDQVLAKIDQLGAQIQSVKPPTPVEKLEMRSLDSGPFSQKPTEFFDQKQEEMRKSGKNEYVLTKGDVENYGKYDMMKSFNPSASNY